MDTKSLTVGQEVYMIAGPFANMGAVVRVTPWGVEVQTCCPRYRCYFDRDGKECDSEGKLYPASAWPWGRAPEIGPWELSDDEQGLRQIKTGR